MRTVIDKKETSEYLVYPNSSLSENQCIQFEIKGLLPERSYEDRSVYINITSVSLDDSDLSLSSSENIVMWLNGEDCIELGIKLIEQGKFALEGNMINHQSIHRFNCLKLYIEEERVEELVFEVIDNEPVGYGQGYKTFRITPTWNEGMAPQYDEDFYLDKVIYWSCLEIEYADQIDYYTGGVSYSFVGYDREEEVRKFNEELELMS